VGAGAATGSGRRAPGSPELLRRIEQRVLWLAVRMVDAANHERDTGDGVKVGGHQASSTSMVSIATALYFAHLDAEDRVSFKPHAAPVYHAIQYLLGNLDRSYLTRLRSLGGLQSYPSRTKDPDGVDFSTGSVGLGAAAPVFAAVARRYVDAHFGPRPRSRFVALIGDAELDEGNVWEAVGDPVTKGLGNVLWVVDYNRQSLDRVVPGVRIGQLHRQFEAAGWQVIELKYGSRLTRAFRALPHGNELHAWLDAMTNEQYQALFGCADEELRKLFLDGAPRAVEEAVREVPDGLLRELVQDLGGHDLTALLRAYRSADKAQDRPTVVFAYTIKGYGLPIAGNPLNHAMLLSTEQVDALRERLGLTRETEWDGFDPASPEGQWCARRAAELRRTEVPGTAFPVPPRETPAGRQRGRVATQEALGRVLVELSRDEGVRPFLVTASPDVAVSTNLAGWINRVGVFSPKEQHEWGGRVGPLRWREDPRGQHLELGISEMNLFLLLGQLGLARELSGQVLLPVGTVYDPFVCRGLDAFVYAAYSGARFLVVGTPSGIMLAPEGGAHQSVITPSIGTELPGVVFYEPAYVRALDWLVCDALARIASGAGDGIAYFRLTTRPLDQGPFEAALERHGEEELRRQVLCGGYRLREPEDGVGPVVHLAASGAVLPEVLAAAEVLEEEGVAACVVDVTSVDLLYRGWRRTLREGWRSARVPSGTGPLEELFRPRGPVVTVHDAASHTMAFLGAALGVPTVPLGVDAFGQSGSVPELYREYDLSVDAVVNAALVALALEEERLRSGEEWDGLGRLPVTLDTTSE
jgi:pyruvate dehydrogenase E1 component